MQFKGQNLCDFCFMQKDGDGACPSCGLSEKTYNIDAGLLIPGTNLNGKYIIGKLLGRGGFGATYLAYSSDLGKRVAIKEYLPVGIVYRGKDEAKITIVSEEKKQVFEKGASRFFEEAKTISRFNRNPNVVSVYEFFYANDTVYYSMEYLEGTDLKKYIDSKGGKLSVSETIGIIQSVCNALIVVHSTQTLHRDISPDNIYICRNGDVKLIDFGAAKQVLNDEQQSYSVVVKQGFAPAEQYSKRGNQGVWTDIYALGATMYYMLMGKVPADAIDRTENPELEFDFKLDCAQELFAVISKCMEPRISNRYQSVVELIGDINNIRITPEIPKVAEKHNVDAATAENISGTNNSGFEGTKNEFKTNAVKQEKIKPVKEKSPNAKAGMNLWASYMGLFKNKIYAWITLGAAAAAIITLISVIIYYALPPIVVDDRGGGGGGETASDVTQVVAEFCSVCGSKEHTVHPTCPDCGSIDHTEHPTCSVCGSKEHTEHPEEVKEKDDSASKPKCPVCGSTAHTRHPKAKCAVCGSTAHTKHPTCSVCGSTAHTKHPTCPTCGSTEHTTHPVAKCPTCGSTAHTTHPKTEKPKTEAPKTEKPKTEKPKTEAPKTEKPKTETPKCAVCGSTAHTTHPTCPTCGSTAHTTHPTCPTCGSTEHTTHPNATCPVCGSSAHTSHPTCPICGSTAHTTHPTCPTCGSTAHTTHPNTNCPICGSTAHTAHPTCPTCGSTEHTTHPSSGAPVITQGW